MKRNHVHRLKKHKYKNGEVVFFCIKDDCSFKINADLTWGKSCECWRCDKPFAMNNETKRQDKPHCDNCTNFRSEETRRKHELKQAKPTPTPPLPEQDLRSRLDRITSFNSLPSEEYPDEDML